MGKKRNRLQAFGRRMQQGSVEKETMILESRCAKL